MTYRRNHSDAAIGWISTADSLLLGFGLMLLFALDTSMSRRALAIKLADQAVAVARQKADAEENVRLTKALDTAAVELERRTGELVELQRVHSAIAQGPEGAKRELQKAWADRDRLKAVNAASSFSLESARRESAKLQQELDDTSRSLALVRRERDELVKEKQKILHEAQTTTQQLKQSEIDLRKQGERLAAIEEELRQIEAAKGLLLAKLNAEATRQKQSAATDVLGFKGPFRNVVFVIDRSKSMLMADKATPPEAGSNGPEGSRWENTKKEILEWSRHLPMQSLQLILFNNNIDVLPGPGKYYDMDGDSRTRSLTAINALLERTAPKGQTDTLGALMKAYAAPGVDTVILFTDGKPELGKVRTSQALSDDIAKLIRRHKTIPVNVVGIGNYFEQDFAKFLRDIANTTGGQFIGR